MTLRHTERLTNFVETIVLDDLRIIRLTRKNFIFLTCLKDYIYAIYQKGIMLNMMNIHHCKTIVCFLINTVDVLVYKYILTRMKTSISSKAM